GNSVSNRIRGSSPIAPERTKPPAPVWRRNSDGPDGRKRARSPEAGRRGRKPVCRWKPEQVNSEPIPRSKCLQLSPKEVDCRFITKLALAQDHLSQNRMVASMTTPNLVTAFYERIWNAGDLGAVSELLIEDFSFRGSLGAELRGREAFKDYVRSVRGAF